MYFELKNDSHGKLEIKIISVVDRLDIDKADDRTLVVHYVLLQSKIAVLVIFSEVRRDRLMN